MPFIPVKREWTSKPPVGTPLRTDGHWSVRGLIGAWAFGPDVVDLVSGRHPTLINTNVARSANGINVTPASGTGYGIPTLATINKNLYKATLFSVMSPRVRANDWEFFCGLVDPSGYGEYKFAITSGNDVADDYNVMCIIDNYYNESAKACTRSTTNVKSLAATYDGTAIRTYYNGIAGEVDSSLGGSGLPISTPLEVAIGGRANYAEISGPCEYQALYVYDRDLLASEIRSLSANPWQVFEPETTWISTGTTTATLTQYSYRFLNDDGSESTATFSGGLNTSVTLSQGDIRRLRILLDATGDVEGKQFQLEYRRKPSGGSFGDWTKVT